MNNEKPMVEPEDQRRAMTKPRNPYLLAALASSALPPSTSQEQTNELPSGLTQSDCQAMADLGSPDEFVSRVLGQVQPTAEVDLPTSVEELATTKPVFGSPFWKEQTTVGLEELLKALRAFERDELVSWTSRYLKKRELGRGGQGVVYLTECLDEFGGERALKILSPEPYGDAQAYQEDMERMGHVASLVHRIPHDNLLDVERFAEHDGIHVIVMQWIDGYDLRQLLDPELLERLSACVDEARWKHLTDVVVSTRRTKQLCLKPGIAVNVIEKCLRGLCALHGEEIVHGDIKPSNIMLDCFGSIKLVDIGSAFELTSPPRQHTWTPQYAAPEFLESGKWLPQSDLASLGYVLIELLSGQPAIASPHASLMSTRTVDKDRNQELLKVKRLLPGRLHEILPPSAQRSEHLMRLCRRLIDPDPERRFATAAEAIEGPDGTFNFGKQLACGNLVVHYAQEITRWLRDVKKAELPPTESASRQRSK